jgi:thiol:disulfide interchange protein DsbA
MKRTFYTFLLCVLLTPTWSFAADYLEGIEYVRLPQAQPIETGKKIEVREVFWYGCPHCYHLEPLLNQWLKTKPGNVGFVRMPGIMSPNWEPLGRAYYALQALGMDEKLHTALFAAIHEKNENLNDEASIADFVARHGVDKAKFVQAYHSFSVDAEIKNAIQVEQRYGVDSVPTFIIDGKFRTNAGMVADRDRNNPNKALMDIVNYLVKKAARERAQAARR